jgi:alpha-beta hydrolase superfamily lysophospholipase
MTSADGARLHLQWWPLAQAADARGTVLIVHGLGEHIGRHGHVARKLNSWGWQVVGHDQRGHGRSDGARGALPADDTLLLDLALLIDQARATWPGPLVLLGHSMGGLVAARFVAGAAASWHRAVDALVLSSPALDAGLSPIQKGLLALLGRPAPDLALGNGLKAQWLSHDAAVVQAYIDDPLVHDRITPRLVKFIVEGGREVFARAPHWPLPTLLLYAGADRCVAPAGSAAFVAAVPAAQLTHQAFASMYHEIFNEPDKDAVFGVLEAWLAKLTVV